MKQVIYIDILIAVNLIINYFLILATAKFLYLKLNRKRLIFGEILGAIYSLYIFLPNLNLTVSLIIKFLMSLTIIWTIFGIKNFKLFIKTLTCFYIISFCFSGIMFALWYALRPNGMTINNGVVYFNISPVMLISLTLISYIILEIINRILDKRESKSLLYDVCIKVGNKSTHIKAKIDTGNSLTEPFSQLPVIVATYQSLEAVLPKDFPSSLLSNNIGPEYVNPSNTNIRLIPFKTVSGDGLFPAFKPDSISIKSGPDRQAYVAVCPDKSLPREMSALINPLLID